MLRAIRTIDYIIILCQDIERMKRFYQEVLGFPLSSEGSEWIDFHVGATRLALRKRGRIYDGPPPPKGTAPLHLAFQVALAQVDSCFAKLQQQGSTSSSPRPIRSGGIGPSSSKTQKARFLKSMQMCDPSSFLGKIREEQ